MHEQTERLAGRFKPSWLDLTCVAVVDFLKTSAELITLCGLFKYISERFDSTPASVGYYLMSVALGVYIGNRLTFATSSLLPDGWLVGWQKSLPSPFARYCSAQEPR